MSIDNPMDGMYTGSIEGVGFAVFIEKKMYKQILLTNKELELLASIIHSYIEQKRDKPGFEINNAHILLRHISGQKPTENTNQIAFYG